MSLASEDGNLCLPSSGVLDAVAAACFSQMETLAAGFAIRGGIEIGLGSSIGDREVYGPVLSCAHHLESRAAGHPRIIAGRELVKYLRGLAGYEPTSEREEAAVQYAKWGIGLLANDEDGLVITDFAGRQAREVFQYSRDREPGDAAERFGKAFSFVEGEYLRMIEEGDSKLAARYLWLLRYLDSRSEHWTD